MAIKEKFGVKKQRWEEYKTKVKVFLQEKLGLDIEEITLERAHKDRNKKEEGKRRTIIATILNYKQR